MKTTMVTILLLSIVPPVQNNHIVFEEISEMTGTISYLHIILLVDIQWFKEKANRYNDRIRDFKKAT